MPTIKREMISRQREVAQASSRVAAQRLFGNRLRNFFRPAVIFGGAAAQGIARIPSALGGSGVAHHLRWTSG